MRATHQAEGCPFSPLPTTAGWIPCDESTAARLPKIPPPFPATETKLSVARSMQRAQLRQLAPKSPELCLTSVGRLVPSRRPEFSVTFRPLWSEKHPLLTKLVGPDELRQRCDSQPGRNRQS